MAKCQCSISWIKLANTKMKIPVSVRKRAKKFSKNRCFEANNKLMVSVITKKGYKYLLRSFQLYRNKDNTVDITECRRQYANEKAILCNCEYGGYLTGWRIYSGYEWDFTDAYECWTEDKNGGPWWGTVLNRDEVIEKYFPHCAYYQTNLDFWYYIQLYLKEPKLELLAKAGYARLIPSYRLLNRKAKTLPDILKVNSRWVEYLKGKCVWHLLACRKNVQTEEEVEVLAEILATPETRKLLKYAPGHEVQMANYIHSHCYGSLSIYEDYLRFAKELAVPLTEKKHLFPENLLEKHDALAKQVKISRDRITDEKIMRQYTKLLKFEFDDGQLFIRPAKSVNELIDESKQMSNCVRTYQDRYANGETGIFFIRKIDDPNKSYVTVELKGKLVKQVYAAHNRHPEETVNEFVNKWKAVYKLT